MRKTAIILAVIMVFVTLLPASSLADESQNISYSEILEAFGIVENGDIGEGEEVSRSLLVKAAVAICGIDAKVNVSDDEVCPFTDVDIYTNNYASIIYACKLGIISGTSALTFEPDKAIKYCDAVKVLVSALGYAEIAKSAGGYPSGYLTVASQKGMLKGISQSADSYLTHANFARLLYNCLEVEVMEISSLSSAGISLKTGDVLREKVFGIYKVSGIVESNQYTSLNGITNVGRGQVYISGKTLMAGETDCADLLGLKVEGYYKKDDRGNNTLLYIKQNDAGNEVVTVSGKEISDATTKTSFAYYDEAKGKEVKLPVSVTASLIYNGGQTELTKERITPSNGETVLIDNNNDGVFDVLKVMDYTTIVVYGIDSSDCTITGKNQEVIVLDSNNTEYDMVLLKKGMPVTFDNISINNVISYAEPLGVKNIKYAIISSEKVTGKVSELNGDYVIINDTEYETAPSAALTLGMTGTFYLDFKGVIVSHKAEFDAVYGYLNAIHKKAGLSASVTAELFTENGNWVQLKLCDRIDFGGEIKTAIEFYNDIADKSFRQLVKYRVNEEGKISAIYFAVKSTWLSEEEKSMIDSAVFRMSNYLESSMYRSNATSFNAVINLLPTTVIFVVPSDPQDKDAFQIASNSNLVSGRTYTNIYSYDADRTGVPNVCVVDDNMSEIVVTSSFAVVDEIRTYLGADGEEVKGLRCYYSGSQPTTLPVKSEEVLQKAGNLKKGDIIQYSVDSSNTISKITLHYSPYNESEPFMKGNIYSSFTLVLGEVKSINYQNARMTVDYGKFGTFGLNNLGNLWIYDTERGIAELGTAEDIHEGDTLFMRVNYLQAIDIIIFE